ncbi:MAG: glycoside hydrolase family 97 catalytic domain-containing protein [Sediminibacterium sp.]
MKKCKLIFLFVCTFFTGALFAQAQASQASPDKQLVFFIRTGTDKGVEYKVEYKAKAITEWSSLGLVLTDRTIAASATAFSKIIKTQVDETFDWLFGENATIRNNYYSLTVHCKQADGILFTIEARVFNNNVAFRYFLPAQKVINPAHIIAENTAFNFDRLYTGYRHNTESVITPTPVNELTVNSDFPLVLSSPGLFISINEAANDNYTKALIGKGEVENSLAIKFSKDTVKINGDFYSPWRTLSIAETAIGLCANSDLLYKLNKPAPAANYSWIKPGKLIRDMTLTTKGATACIDFAAKMNFQYIMFDAGWYGKGYSAEFDQSSNPRNIVPEINMQQVIRYGQSKNIGLVLYVNYVGLKRYDMDSSFTLYKKWGVKGLKFGFVKGLTQEGISWLMGAVKKAQDYGFIIDVHDNYKPTGISRTMPAWLTQEGVRGNENNPDAFHNTTLPFTRFLSGAADYTFCYRNQNDSFNNVLLSKKLQVSKAQQLALTVIYYSPLQSMLWYGRPADYQLPEEIEFFKYVPTVWDKTLYLNGEISQYITVARKKQGIWYMGTAVSDKPYKKNIPLSFLDKGKTYEAFIYEDDGKGGIKKSIKDVNSKSILAIDVLPKGGQAVMIKIK